MIPMNETVDTIVVGPGATVHARLSWSAIFAGWLVATAVAGLLYIAGMALGFAAFDPYAADGAIKGIGIGTAIWLIATWGAGLFVGGLFASWFDGRSDQTVGVMHGIAVWGLSMTAAAVWMSLSVGQVLQHRTDTRPHTDAAMQVAAATDNDALLILQANVRRLTPVAEGMSTYERGNDDAIVASILANKMDTARGLLMADGVSSGQIDQVMPRLANEADAANKQIKADANRAARYTAIALWVAFLSGLLALLGAAVGGWLGSHNVHRVYHLRRYADRPYRTV